MENTNTREGKPVAIIGLGPAGVTASIMLKEWGYEPDVYEVGLTGGLVNQTAEIDNYPGFLGTGMDLAMKFDEDVNRMKIHVVHSIVKNLEKDGDGHFLITTAKGQFLYEAVIVATGTHYRPYDVPGQDKIKGRGFSRCAICDGPLYKNKDVAVVGGGNSAFEEGLYLSSICHSVTLINRRDLFRAPMKVIEMFKARDNTRILTPAVIDSCDGDGKLEKLMLRNPNDPSNKVIETLNVSACFVYIGSDPTTQFVKIPGSLDNKGYMAVDEDMNVKDVPGLFGCGDCIDISLRQVATAVGTGSKAGYSAVRYLLRKEKSHE